MIPGSFYDDSVILQDDDDNLQLLTNKSPIAGRSRQQQQQQQQQASAPSHTDTIPLHRATSQPQVARKRKSFNIKDTINGLLGKTNAASGTAGEGGERIIHLNNQELNDQQKFLHNRVFTAKYTAFTFLPKFLYEEFSKYANLFFLFISGIQVRQIIVHAKVASIRLNLIFLIANPRYFTYQQIYHTCTFGHCIIHYCCKGGDWGLGNYHFIQLSRHAPLTFCYLLGRASIRRRTQCQKM